MTNSPLKNIAPGPSMVLLPEADPASLAECLVAFANSDGGNIVLGIDETGNQSNVIWEEEVEGVLKQAASLCRPPVASDWSAMESQHGLLITIRVKRGAELHSLVDGRVYIRSGAHNRLLHGNELTRLAAGKTSPDYESDTVPGASRDVFDQDILDEYLAKREERGVSRVGPLSDLLFEIGAVDQHGNPTVAGILLFGQKPQAFLPQCGIVFVRFPGIEPGAEDGSAGYGRRDEIHGPVARVVERSWNIIWEEMRVGAVLNGLRREDVTEYPPFAVREALVNAVAHRDYRIRGRRIEIRMYRDRLEVISPGGLPGYITVDNIVEEHFSRNPRLVNGLFQWGYIEELGLGIDRMIEDMVQAGHPPPKFLASPNLFTVRLSNERKRQEIPRWSQRLNERQMKAMTFIQDRGSITNREYLRLCPGVTSETIRLDLVDLVKRGLILKIGSKKGTQYILK